MITKTRLITLLYLCFVFVSPVLAHGLEHENPSDIEIVVSGIGTILIILVGVYVHLTAKRSNTRKK